jgi:hypothetical protein
MMTSGGTTLAERIASSAGSLSRGSREPARMTDGASGPSAWRSGVSGDFQTRVSRSRRAANEARLPSPSRASSLRRPIGRS